MCGVGPATADGSGEQGEVAVEVVERAGIDLLPDPATYVGAGRKVSDDRSVVRAGSGCGGPFAATGSSGLHSFGLQSHDRTIGRGRGVGRKITTADGNGALALPPTNRTRPFTSRTSSALIT